jgi:uncharacterized membrane-anchored protein
MKNILALILLSANISFAQVSFNGNVNYIKQDSENLTSKNNIAYKFKLYEDHKYIVSLSNALSVDLDAFKNEIKETNVFTTLQIEF